MTKKSLARMKRDDAKKQLQEQEQNLKKNRCWDELLDLHAQCASTFHRYAELGKYMKNKELMACVPDVKGVTERIMIITRDLQGLKEELNQIFGHHSGKSGGPIGDNLDTRAQNLMECFEIYQHYMMWTEKHDGTVLPVYNELMAAIMVGEQRLKTVVSTVTGETMDQVDAAIQNAQIDVTALEPATA